MELTISGSPSEIENFISKISFGNKDPTCTIIDDYIPPAPEPVEPEIVTKVIELPPIFDTKIERITSIPKIVPVESEVKGKTFRQSTDGVKNVDITFAETGILYKKFVSSSAASHFFGKTNLSENLRKGFKFCYNGIWFNIKYSNNVCK